MSGRNFHYTPLQRARIRAGLTRRELAQLSGVSYERLRQLEHVPERAQPRLATARAVAMVLGTAVQELFPELSVSGGATKRAQGGRDAQHEPQGRSRRRVQA